MSRSLVLPITFVLVLPHLARAARPLAPLPGAVPAGKGSHAVVSRPRRGGSPIGRVKRAQSLRAGAGGASGRELAARRNGEMEEILLVDSQLRDLAEQPILGPDHADRLEERFARLQRRFWELHGSLNGWNPGN
jgi:hypothetical protein